MEMAKGTVATKQRRRTKEKKGPKRWDETKWNLNKEKKSTNRE